MVTVAYEFPALISALLQPPFLRERGLPHLYAKACRPVSVALSLFFKHDAAASTGIAHLGGAFHSFSPVYQTRKSKLVHAKLHSCFTEISTACRII
jgi:hypothetical protein